MGPSYAPWLESLYVGLASLAHPHLILSQDYLVFALLGFLSPSNRGSLATVMMICWTFFGRFGYVLRRHDLQSLL
jgi:transmembrane 9 superfamily protein 2/4